MIKISEWVIPGSSVEIDKGDATQLPEGEAECLRDTYFTSHVSKMTSNCNYNSGGGSYSIYIYIYNQRNLIMNMNLTSCNKSLKKKKDRIDDSIWTQFLFPLKLGSQKHVKYIKYCEK